jgi:hypothetical protein
LKRAEGLCRPSDEAAQVVLDAFDAKYGKRCPMIVRS